MSKVIPIFLFVMCLLTTGCGTSKNGFRLTTDKNELTVEIKKEQEKSLTIGNQFYNFFKDFGSIILTIIGFIIGHRLLTRKLLENHITTALTDIQKGNKETLKKAIKLIDEVIEDIQFNRKEALNKEAKDVIENLLKKINDLYLTSQDGSSECQTLLFFLKLTLEETLSLISNKQTVMSNQSIFYMTRITLNRVTFFATQAVPVPSSGKTTYKELISKELRKYVNNSKYRKYKHFNQGVIYDPNSALFLIFCLDTLTSNSEIKRSIFKIHWCIPPILKAMYASNIYAPLKIKWKNPETDSVFILYLIGYKEDSITYHSDGKVETHIELIYTNPIDNLSIVDSLVKNKRIPNFDDVHIVGTGFKFKNTDKVSIDSFETIKIKVDPSYLTQMYKDNKKKIKKHLNPKTDRE